MIKQHLEYISQFVYNTYSIQLFIFNKESKHTFTTRESLMSPIFDSVELFVSRLIQPDNQQKLYEYYSQLELLSQKQI